MAKQTGIIKLKGTIGDISFYKTKDGHLAREKTSVDAERIKNDPAYQRTRENGSEFGRAIKSGKLLRTALRLLLQVGADKRVSNRVTQAMMKVIKSDQTNPRGQRKASDGDLSHFLDFNFNINAKLNSIFYGEYSFAIDRVSGEAELQVEAYTPSNTIISPTGTIHYKVSSGAAEVDFDNSTFAFKMQEGTIESIDTQNIPVALHSLNLTANTQLPIFQVMVIEFYQEVNGTMYPLKNGAYNSISIVNIDTPA